MQLNALFRLGFPPAPALPSLNLAAYRNSQAHSTKGTLSPVAGLQPVVGPWFQVLFHSPRRGSFRLSLTVLYAIGSRGVFSLGSWSTRIPARFLVPRRTQVPFHGVVTISRTGISPSLSGFPKTVPLC